MYLVIPTVSTCYLIMLHLYKYPIYILIIMCLFGGLIGCSTETDTNKVSQNNQAHQQGLEDTLRESTLDTVALARQKQMGYILDSLLTFNSQQQLIAAFGAARYLSIQVLYPKEWAVIYTINSMPEQKTR